MTRTLALSPVPLYTQVKESLREGILDGTYPPHSQLPPESEIGSIFDVSRITVRQALRDLQTEGLIFKVPGKGTFVSKPKAFQELTQLEGFAEAMSRQGHDIYNRVTGLRTVAATARLAQQLQVGEGTPLAEIRRIRLLNREPVSLEITYVSEALGERLRREDLARRDIFLILENDYGIALGKASLSIDAAPADMEVAAALQLSVGMPVLRIERLTHTAARRPLDFEYLYFRGDAFQYRLQLARRTTNQE